jgi:hypothetical protein
MDVGLKEKRRFSRRFRSIVRIVGGFLGDGDVVDVALTHAG